MGVRDIKTHENWPPAAVARAVLFGALGANLLFVWITFAVTDVPQKNALITVGRFLGLHVALVMIFQLVLIARIPWLDRRLGMDQLTSLHRWVGFTLFWTLLLHVAFIVTGFAQLYHNPVPVQLVSLAGSLPVALGLIAFVIVAVVAVISARRARRRMSYETWHAVHFLLYLVIVLALIHQMFEITTFTASAWTRTYWWLLWTAALTALVVGRVVLPMLRNARHRYRSWPSCRRPATWCRCMSPGVTSTVSRHGPASSCCGDSQVTTPGGRSIRGRCRQRRMDRRCG